MERDESSDVKVIISLQRRDKAATKPLKRSEILLVLHSQLDPLSST